MKRYSQKKCYLIKKGAGVYNSDTASTFLEGGILLSHVFAKSVLEPELHKIHSGKAAAGKTIIIIPGILTAQKKPSPTACDLKKRNKVKYLEPLLKSGWDGDVHYLWWNSSTPSHFGTDIIRTLLLAFGLPILLFLSLLVLGAVVGDISYYIPIAYTHENILLCVAYILGFGILSAVAFIVYKYIKIHKRASSAAQDYLPQAINRYVDRVEGANKEKYRFSFLAHSMGSYVLHKWVKKYNNDKWITKNLKKNYRIQNPIDDIILLGAAVHIQEKLWFRKGSLFAFGSMINVYNTKDRVLDLYELLDKLRKWRPGESAGSGTVNGALNISLEKQTHTGVASHFQYKLVFDKGILRYNGEKWLIDNDKLEILKGN